MKKTNVLVINTLTIKLEINNHFNNGCNAQIHCPTPSATTGILRSMSTSGLT